MTTTGRGEHDTETRPSESAAELRGEMVELLRRFGLQIPTARKWVGDFEAAVRAEEREQIAQRIEAEVLHGYGDLSEGIGQRCANIARGES